MSGSWTGMDLVLAVTILGGKNDKMRFVTFNAGLYAVLLGSSLVLLTARQQVADQVTWKALCQLKLCSLHMAVY